MKLPVAMDNLAKFFKEDENRALLQAEAFKDSNGKIIEIRIYNVEYEQLITINREGQVEALSVDEYENNIKFK